MGGEVRDQPFTFLIDGKKVDAAFDLTDGGAVGVYDPDGWIRSVRADGTKQSEFLKLLVKADALFVEGFEYKMDDLSQIPCMK